MRDTNLKRRGARRAGRSAGFSLIELVIVVVIIAIIGAIAIPKMSRGASGASESALIQDLSTMRAALEMYAQEHGGNYPTGTAANVTNQLTEYSDGLGNVNATKTAACMYGPYLKVFPSLPVGQQRTNSTIVASGTPGAPTTATAGAGWVYDTQTFWANCATSELDAEGKAYNSY